MESSNYLDQIILEVAENLSKRFSAYQEREDLKQEICLALLKAKKRYDPSKASWKTFAYETGRWMISEYSRNHPLKGRDWNRTSQSVIYLVSTNDLLKEPHTSDEESLDLVLLPYKGRDKTVALCLILGYSKTDIASMLHISVTQISRILRRLRLENLRYSRYHPTD